jgi:hypothetical protein
VFVASWDTAVAIQATRKIMGESPDERRVGSRVCGVTCNDASSEDAIVTRKPGEDEEAKLKVQS